MECPTCGGSGRISRPKPSGDPEIIFSVDFEQWWLAYPKFRRKAKKQAQAKWAKLSDLDRQHAMIDVVGNERAKRDPEWAKEGGKYAPGPVVYLNGERWTDEWQVTTPADPMSEEARARRLSEQSGMAYEDALEIIRERLDESERNDE